MQPGKSIRQKRLMPLFAGLGVILGIVAAAYLYSSYWNQKGSSEASKFRSAPDFQLSDASGQIHPLSEFRGRVVLLHFWASWCPPCLGEIPEWIELAGNLKGKPIQLVAISTDENWAAAQKVLPSDHLPDGMVSLIDPKSQVSERYGTYAFPETYLIGPKGEIITKWVGPQNWKSAEFMKMMDEIAQRAAKSS